MYKIDCSLSLISLLSINGFFQACMKQESEVDIMDIDCNQPDPFGPSSSVSFHFLLYAGIQNY